MSKGVSDILKQLKDYNPKKIILFGSYAYGRPNQDSDIDLVLIKETKDPFHDRLKKVRMLLKTTTPVDIFVFTPKEFAKAQKTNPLLREIAKRGKTVYG